MPKLTVQLVVYNSKKYLKQVFDSVYAQDFKDFEFIVVICGNEDNSKEWIIANFPMVKILDPGKNLGFAGGHNLAFKEAKGEFVQLIGNDLILEPSYFSEQLKSFEGSFVASSTGKLFGFDFERNEKKGVLDTTGVEIYASGRARDRGQHEKDSGQYDNEKYLAAVSGAAPMYRKAMLSEVGYFDEDFFMYWEDVDLGLRFLHAGYKNVFTPSAIGYHGRGSGSSEGGIKKFSSFMKTRASRSLFVRKLNYKNHIFLVLKNYPRLGFQFVKREVLMFGFTLLFEFRTLAFLPVFFSQISGILKKRREILGTSKINRSEFENYFVKNESELA